MISKHEEAIKLQMEWSKWLVAIQAVALGYFKTQSTLPHQWASISFALSILFAAWVLGALPIIVQKLNGVTTTIGDMKAFGRIKLWYLCGAQHLFFALGIVALILNLP